MFVILGSVEMTAEADAAGLAVVDSHRRDEGRDDGFRRRCRRQSVLLER